MPAEVVNLANVYAFLRDSYDSVDVLLAPPPTYIQSLSEIDSKIVFIHKYDEVRSKATLDGGNRFSPKVKDTSQVDLDLTGSPLKDDVKLEDLNMSTDQNGLVCFENPWLEREECYAPIPVEKARPILQEVLNSGAAGSGHLWALCDGKDMDQTLLLQVEINTMNKFVRGVVKLLGYFPEEQLTMVKLQRIHDTRAPGFTKELETSIELWYKIQSHISVKLRWITNSEHPSFLINKKADIVLRQAIQVNDTQSVAEYFWSQLHLLDIIKDRILQVRSEGKTNLEDEWFAGTLDVDLIEEKVHKILTEFCVVESTEYKLAQIGSIVERVKNRSAADVTDRLWSVLKYCSCYDDLKDVLTFIFKAASRSYLANIPSNNNRLAQLIKSIAQGRLAIPILTGAEPLELLLEIGLEKIFKDYQIIFHESKICNLDLANVGKTTNVRHDSMKVSRASSIRKSMYEAVPSSQSRKTALLSNPGDTKQLDDDDDGAIRNSYFNEDEANMRIAKLAQIHMLLEHLLSIETHLKLTSIYPQVAEEYFARPTVCFEEMRSRKTDRLEIPILNNKIIELVENSSPYIRRVGMASKSKFRTVQSVFYQSTDPILPTNLFSQLKSDETDVKNGYWCLEYTKIINH
ncbi:protein zwilch [Toxorhynchites rutilus septentrionalis]|uniref:protein zwilch n=1 Tax=Toxorhynchites rutilus septentrionalis TaxID=329112 RepID=UPI00247A7D04|nr:protein zwilch [Toxorhynchites rutilus septentrionalis]